MHKLYSRFQQLVKEPSSLRCGFKITGAEYHKDSFGGDDVLLVSLRGEGREVGYGLFGKRHIEDFLREAQAELRNDKVLGLHGTLVTAHLDGYGRAIECISVRE